MLRTYRLILVAIALAVPNHTLAQTAQELKQIEDAVRLARMPTVLQMPRGMPTIAGAQAFNDPYATALSFLERQMSVTPAIRSAVAKEIADQENQEKFKGFKVGFGFAYTGSSNNERIKNVAVANGIVRVNKENNETTRALAEVHYFFTPNYKLLGLVDKGQWGIGPFVAADISAGGVGGLGFGVMLGMKQPEGTAFYLPAGNASWNIGIGGFIDPVVTVLGDGIVANQPLPVGESTNVRTKEVSRWGLLLMTSFSF